jgi:hypothetical protein
MITKRIYGWLILSAFYVLCFSQSDVQKSLRFNGQIVGWANVQMDNPVFWQPGARFVPSLTWKQSITSNTTFDAEASLNIYGNADSRNFKTDTLNGQIKPYRVWLRYSNQNFELRAGLQKINFGQARMFRPLMWFDGMDVRDPLQLTDGVYGLLAKYFFENNANIWAWGLLANENRKGWELFGSEKWKPELGGRVELPLLNGEIALSTHHRKVKAINLLSSQLNNFQLLNESRFGLDGKWDVGPGIWFENSTTITQVNNIQVPRYQDMWNFGMDYTFPLGNGLGMTVEYLRYHAGENFLTGGITMQFAGGMFTYPLSVVDNLSLMLFYEPIANQLFNYASWSRNYDNWSIYAIVFVNPENAQMIGFQSGNRNLFAGKGFQVMCSYNF